MKTSTRLRSLGITYNSVRSNKFQVELNITGDLNDSFYFKTHEDMCSFVRNIVCKVFAKKIVNRDVSKGKLSYEVKVETKGNDRTLFWETLPKTTETEDKPYSDSK